MCKELCESSEDGSMQSCQDCGALICFDIEAGDDICRPAFVTSSGDVFCDRCGRSHERAEEETSEDEGWEDDPEYQDFLDDLADAAEED